MVSAGCERPTGGLVEQEETKETETKEQKLKRSPQHD